MKELTKYQYEMRIKNLQRELDSTKEDLHRYRTLAQDIFSSITNLVHEGKQVSQGWLLGQFKRLFR